MAEGFSRGMVKTIGTIENKARVKIKAQICRT